MKRTVQGTPTHKVEQQFLSPKDEYLYGTGQFQDGYLNIKGLSRRLYAAATWSSGVGHDWETLRRQIAGGLSQMATGLPYAGKLMQVVFINGVIPPYSSLYIH